MVSKGLPARASPSARWPLPRRYRLRDQQRLDGCAIDPEVFDGALERLAGFVQPFAGCPVRRGRRRHARAYRSGLVPGLDRKNPESIADRHGERRHGLQHFVGPSTRGHRHLLRERARQVGRELVTPDGLIVFDPPGSPKEGDASAGVQRRWLGRLGRVDGGQVGVFMAYPSHRVHALVDVRLDLPRGWAKDRPRRSRRGIPRPVRYRTRHELAPEMLREAGPLLSHARVPGDDEMGRSSRFRAEPRRPGGRDPLAVLSDTTVRDPDAGRPRGASGGGPEAAARAGPGPGRFAIPGGVAPHRGGRRRAWPDARRAGRGPGGGQDGPGADRAGGVAGGDPLPRRGRGDRARRLPIGRPARSTAGGRWRGSRGPAIASRRACNGARARCGLGRGGTTRWRRHRSRRDSRCGGRGGGKVRTPALGVPRVRAGLTPRCSGGVPVR
jgi:hypothetical protein